MNGPHLNKDYGECHYNSMYYTKALSPAAEKARVAAEVAFKIASAPYVGV